MMDNKEIPDYCDIMYQFPVISVAGSSIDYTKIRKDETALLIDVAIHNPIKFTSSAIKNIKEMFSVPLFHIHDIAYVIEAIEKESFNERPENKDKYKKIFSGYYNSKQHKELKNYNYDDLWGNEIKENFKGFALEKNYLNKASKIMLFSSCIILAFCLFHIFKNKLNATFVISSIVSVLIANVFCAIFVDNNPYYNYSVIWLINLSAVFSLIICKESNKKEEVS